MLDYLRRLATTGFAYTASSVFSKIIAVALLPLYTSLLVPAEYGKAEILFGAVVAASIIVRFGVIEALLRFYYLRDEDGSRVIRTGFAFLFWASTIGSLILLPFAEPIAAALKVGTQLPGMPFGAEPGLVRIAIGGLWLLTLYEYLVSIFRLDERAREYFIFTFANVLLAIPLTLILIAGADLGAEGILLGSYASAIPFVAWLMFSERRRLGLVPERGLLRRMMRFGLPTMPAEFSLYALIFVDRVVIANYLTIAEVGLYSLAFKFSQAIQIFVRGFQLAWPPIAYSIEEDDEAKRVYSTVLTAFTAAAAFIVVGMWLEARWIVRILAADEYFGAYEAIGLLALGAALYGVYLALLVVIGRVGRTEFNFPATLAALLTNLVLNLLLVPEYGIVGAGLALVSSYAIALVLMFAFTQRLFPVPWQWGRLALITFVGAGLVAGGDLLLPTDGFGGLLARAAVWLAYPVLLWFGGLLTAEEKAVVIRLTRPEEIRRRLAELSELRARQAAAGPDGKRGALDETIEAELRDEDRRTF